VIGEVLVIGIPLGDPEFLLVLVCLPADEVAGVEIGRAHV
jgi:hypothetical protein